MIDRASTFSDPDIVSLLKKDFVPVAIDQAYQRRQKDTEGDLYRKIASQSPRNNFQSTTQGLYIASPDGTLLAFSNNRNPRRVQAMMEKALRDFVPHDFQPVVAVSRDDRYNPEPPEGGLVLRVQARVLDGYGETGDRTQRIFQQAVSRDNMWITAGEHNSLARGVVPGEFVERMARFHLVDNTRGEPPMWKKGEIRHMELTCRDGSISGRIELETDDGSRGYQAAITGNYSVDDEKIVSLEMAATGLFYGEGRFTRNAPDGKFPLAVYFQLADGSDIADRIPPQGSRGWVDGYLNP